MVFTIYSIEKNQQTLYKAAVNNAENFPIQYFKDVKEMEGNEVFLEDFYDFSEEEMKEYLIPMGENVWSIKGNFLH